MSRLALYAMSAREATSSLFLCGSERTHLVSCPLRPGGIAMWEAFRNGGWGMFPTLIFGLVFVGVALRYASTPRRALLTPLTVLAALTLSAGALGFVTGFIKSVGAVTKMPEPNPLLALIGAGEAANCIGL